MNLKTINISPKANYTAKEVTILKGMSHCISEHRFIVESSLQGSLFRQSVPPVYTLFLGILALLWGKITIYSELDLCRSVSFLAGL